MTEPLRVTAEEAGQKLLQFLARRFDEPQGVLHRWIRTGQVRINGGRAKPFERVAGGDEIRVPPFAGTRTEKGTAAPDRSGLPPVVAETDDLIVFCKPSGLPVHPGTGHTDSLTTRLEKSFAGVPFVPAPVHRLDRDTSGLLLAGKTYAAVRRLSDALAAHDGGVLKDYVAWVRGECPWEQAARLEDSLSKRTADAKGREKMVVGKSQKPAPGEKAASLTVRRLEVRRGNSLVLVRLHTGRTHQIRAQLAARGFPLIGDVKYGGPPCEDGLKLHAARLRVGGETFTALPPWGGVWRVAALPPAGDGED